MNLSPASYLSRENFCEHDAGVFSTPAYLCWGGRIRTFDWLIQSSRCDSCHEERTRTSENDRDGAAGQAVLTVKKLSYVMPISEELIADSGWPNVCGWGRPCFIHTRYVWYCGEAADPFRDVLR